MGVEIEESQVTDAENCVVLKCIKSWQRAYSFTTNSNLFTLMKPEGPKAPVELGPTYSWAPKSTLPSPSGDIVSDTLESWQGVFDAAAERNPRRAMAIRELALARIHELHKNLRAKLNQQNTKAGIQEKPEHQDGTIQRNIRVLNVALSAFPLNVRVKIIPEEFFALNDSVDEMEQFRKLFQVTQKAIIVMSDAILLDALTLLEKLCESWIQHKWAKTDGREIDDDLSGYRSILLAFPHEALANLPKESFSDDSSFSLQDKIKFLRRNLPSTFDTLRKWFDLKSTTGAFQTARAIHHINRQFDLKSKSEALQTSLSELEAMEARPLPSGLTEKEEAKIYREHVRKVRRIFESLGSNQIRVLDCPYPGESLTSLREKRIAHFSALRADCAARQVRLEEEKKEHARQELIQSEFDAPYRRGCTERESLSRPAKPFAGISDIGSRSGKKSYGVLFGGLFGICLCMALYSLYQDETPSLSWTVLLCALWSSGILLWESNKSQTASIARRSKAWGGKAFKFMVQTLAWALGGVFAFVLISGSMNPGRTFTFQNSLFAGCIVAVARVALVLLLSQDSKK